MVRSYALVLHDIDDDQADYGFAAAASRGGVYPMAAGDLRQFCIDEWRREESRSRRQADADAKRYTCIRCYDAGMLHVWNPWFLAMFREQFMDYTAQGFPADWRGRAHRWWMRQHAESGSMTFMVRCNCSCPASLSYAREQEQFAIGAEKRKRAPACGVATFSESAMPLVTFDGKRDLIEFYNRDAF